MDSAQKRFALGVLLAWAPWALILFGVAYVIRTVPNTMATGFAGGFAEMLGYWGLAWMVVSQVLAIVWLWRSFSRDKMLNNLVGAVSIAVSAVMLLATGFFMWSTWFVAR